MRSAFISISLLATLAFSAVSVLPARADAGGDLENALLNTFNQPSYHMHMTMDNGQTADGDVVKPDRMRMTLPQGQMVVVGSTSYFKMGGAWQKLPGVNPIVSRSNMLNMLKTNKGKYRVADLGMKVVGGVPLHGYRTTDLANGKTNTVYVDGHNRIARIETGADIMQFSNFGEHVSITAPM